MKQPFVSVLMTAYNREDYIGAAIESVLNSSYAAFELIIVDDCSKDRTVEIAEAYKKKDNRIQLHINTVNLGDYSNRNKAASYATGKYLKYVDSDDLIFPETLAIMVDTLEAFPEAALAISSRNKTTVSFYTPYEAYYTHFFLHGFLDIGPTATLIRTSCFRQVGPFKTLRNVGDFDMWLRLSALFPVVEMQKDLVFWREHNGQEIRLGEFAYFEYQLPILIEHFDSPKCPLSPEQREGILKKFRKTLTKALIKRILKVKNVSSCFKVWRSQKLNILDLFT